MQTQHQPVSLAILCGGRSSRLGTDKGLYKPLGDESLVCRAIRLLGSAFGEILVIVHDPEQLDLYRRELTQNNDHDPKIRLVHDQMVAGQWQQSALSGVYSALHFATYSHVVVMPVDQIGVRSFHLKKLLNDFHGSETVPRAFVSSKQNDQLLPFPSLWPTSMKVRLEAALQAGSLGVMRNLWEAKVVPMAVGVYENELMVNGNTQSELADYFGHSPLFDRHGRRMHYLRFSLTEACNMSCQYCLPAGFPEWYRHKARLSAENIDTLLSGFRRMGFRKVRFTGGEPTVHPGAFKALGRARELGFETLTLTTNGILIQNLQDWVANGLTQINISLDTLNESTFETMTKSKGLDKVLKLVDDAVALGLEVKINTVLLRSVNGSQASHLIDWALQKPITLRFIELMPTGLNREFYEREQVLGSEILPLLEARGLAIHDRRRGPDLRGPATVYESLGVPGKIGLINPLSCNFCNHCNRLRVTAKGALKLCLFGDSDLPLDMTSPETVERDVRRLIESKKERHHLEDGDLGNVETFRTIGG